MKWGFLLLLMVAFAAAHPDTLLPEGCGILAEKGFLDADGQASCAFIGTAGSLDDQRAMMSALVYPSIGYVDADFLHAWNTAWKYEQAPDGVQTASASVAGGGTVIKNAWMRIVAVTPNVEDMSSGKRFALPYGEVQTEFNYTVEEPPPVLATGIDKECDTYSWIYTLGDHDDEMTVSLNGKALGTGPAKKQVLLPYSSTGAMDFSADLTVWAKVNIHHNWGVKVCVPSCDDEGNCVPVCYTECHSEELSKTPTVNLHDDYPHLELYHYGFHVFQVMDKPNRAIVHVFSLAPLNNFEFRFGSAYYSQSDWGYGLEYDYAPYNTLRGTAKKTSHTERSDGMIVERSSDENGREVLENYLANYDKKIVDPKGTGAKLLSIASEYPIHHTELKVLVDPSKMAGDACEMDISSHFERLKISGFCNMTSLPETTLTIDTDKEVYEMGGDMAATIKLEQDGEPIAGNVHVEFQDKAWDVWVDGEKTIHMVATASGAIAASYDTDLVHSSTQALKAVTVHHQDAWDGIYAIFLMLLAWGMAYVFLKALLGRRRG